MLPPQRSLVRFPTAWAAGPVAASGATCSSFSAPVSARVTHVLSRCVIHGVCACSPQLCGANAAECPGGCRKERLKGAPPCRGIVGGGGSAPVKKWYGGRRAQVSKTEGEPPAETRPLVCNSTPWRVDRAAPGESNSCPGHRRMVGSLHHGGGRTRPLGRAGLAPDFVVHPSHPAPGARGATRVIPGLPGARRRNASSVHLLLGLRDGRGRGRHLVLRLTLF